MNLVVLSAWFPCPPDNGSRLRAFYLLRHLAARHRVRLVAGRQTDRQGDDAPSDDDLRALLGCESAVSVAWRWHQEGQRGALRALLSPTPRSILETDNPPLRDAVRAHLALPTDAVLVLELGMAPFLPPASARTGAMPPVVLDQVEMSGLTQARHDAPNARARLRAGLTGWKSGRYWQRAVRRFQAVTAVSDEEACAVRRVVGEPQSGAPPVVVVPNGVDVASYQRGASGVAPVPGRLLYNGALGYGPNREAVLWFVREMLPRVALASPGAHLVVTGRTDDVDQETRSALCAAANGQVHLTGFLPDLRPALDAAQVCVVPLRAGGGTRLKILEAFAAGLPVVATTRGAAGIGAEHGRHLLLADTPDDIVAGVARLLQRPVEAASFAREARRLVEERYDWPAIASGLSDLLERVAAKKESEA